MNKSLISLVRFLAFFAGLPLKNEDLEQVYCCNELNCGYAAEGYARVCGAAAAVVTFSVGGTHTARWCAFPGAVW